MLFTAGSLIKGVILGLFGYPSMVAPATEAEVFPGLSNDK